MLFILLFHIALHILRLHSKYTVSIFKGSKIAYTEYFYDIALKGYKTSKSNTREPLDIHLYLYPNKSRNLSWVNSS